MVYISSKIIYCLIIIIHAQSILSHKARRYQNEDKLIFAHVIFRHGNRTIEYTYDRDPFKDPIYWPEGFGTLTTVGRKTEFKLGQYFRRRYKSLLAPDFSPNEVYIRSMEKERTIDSAKCVAAGLLDSTEQRSWKECQTNQIIPIHTVPLNEDYLLFEIPCKLAEKNQAERLESDEVKAILKKYTGLRKYLEKHTGQPMETVFEMRYFYDALNIEKRRCLPLSSWAEKVLKTSNDALKYIRAIYFESFSHTTTSQKARSGFVLKEIFDRFKNKTMGLEPNRSKNLYLYSAHDITIVGALNSLKLYKYKVPFFGSSLHFELYQRGREYYVQLFFRNDNSENLPPIKIPNCGTKCPLDKFYELYKDILPSENENYESVCRSPK